MPRAILLCSVLVLAGCGGNEQTYQGHTLSYWAGRLQNKDPKDRREAIKALIGIADKEKADVRPLVGPATEALKNDDPDVRAKAARLFEKIGSPVARPAVPALLAAVKDPAAPVRAQAAQALGVVGIGAADVIPTLSAALKDEDADVRRCAAVALGNMGPPAKEAVPAMKEVVKKEKQAEWKDEIMRAVHRLEQAQ